jgi:hypothetical protein
MCEIKSCKYRRGELLLFSILLTGLVINVYDLDLQNVVINWKQFVDRCDPLYRQLARKPIS